jgi:hypothetical protein
VAVDLRRDASRSGATASKLQDAPTSFCGTNPIGPRRPWEELRQTLNLERVAVLQILDQNQSLMPGLTIFAHCQCGEKLAQKQG